MGGRTRAPYPPEYKAELVRLVREEGRSPSELAREFEPSAARLGSKPPSMPERRSVHLLRSLAFTAPPRPAAGSSRVADAHPL